MKTLNTCLSKLDEIIIGGVDDRNLVLGILNGIRKYIINNHYETLRMSSKKQSLLFILQFINYMIEETISCPITNGFINHCKVLRLFILQLETDSILTIDEDDVDFDNKCNSFLNKYCMFGDDDDSDDEDIKDDENDVKDNENVIEDGSK